MVNLQGKRGLVVGVANKDSIAWGCAAAMREAGASLALTYLNDKAKGYLEPLAEELQADMLLPLDVEAPGQMDALFAEVGSRWGKLDFLVHSIAFAPAADLHGRVVDCSLAGFERAMRISCYSLLEMARAAEPLVVESDLYQDGAAERLAEAERVDPQLHRRSGRAERHGREGRCGRPGEPVRVGGVPERDRRHRRLLRGRARGADQPRLLGFEPLRRTR